MKSLAEFHSRYEDIMAADWPTPEARDRALSSLMTEMEGQWPVLMPHREWEAKHKTVIALYRIISESRITV